MLNKDRKINRYLKGNKLNYKVLNKAKVYVIDNNLFNISNDYTNATETTKGINSAIMYAKENGYDKVILQDGIYAIDINVQSDAPVVGRWKARGIYIPDNIIVELSKNTILKMIPVSSPSYNIVSAYGSNNSIFQGGTIIGDVNEHLYDKIIKDCWEHGNIDIEDGENIEESGNIRTSSFIDLTTLDSGEPFYSHNNYYIMPHKNTSMNTVDGGRCTSYYYDENYNFISAKQNGYITKRTKPENAKYLKISIWNENNLNAILFFHDGEKIWASHEFGFGISVGGCDNFTVRDMTIKDCVGDCIFTNDMNQEHYVNNFNVINCDLSGSRRQGISYVATGDSYLVKGCKIHDIGGVDPQAGIDYEHYGYVTNAIVEDCEFYNNKKLDIINYNGTSVTLRRNKFGGFVGTTYGKQMNVISNIFEYDGYDEHIHTGAISVDATISPSMLDDNIFIGHPRGGSFAGDFIKNNTIINKTTSFVEYVFNAKSSSILGVDVSNCIIKANSGVVENSSFDNSNISGGYLKDLTVLNSTLIDSKLVSGGGAIDGTRADIQLVKNSTVKFTKNVSDPGVNMIYEDCIIETYLNNKDGIIHNCLAPVTVSFKNCTIHTQRCKFITSYIPVTFDNCNIIFEDSFEDATVNFCMVAGNGSKNGSFVFNNCTFENKTSKNVKIMNSNNDASSNNTVIGNVTFNK